MSILKYKFFTFYFFLFLLSFNISFGSDLKLFISENIIANQISSNQVDLEIKGNISIKNLNLIDSIYQYNFIFKDDFIFDFKINNTNLTYLNKKIIGRYISNNSNTSFSYTLYGIISTDNFNKFKLEDISFLEYNLKDIRFDSNREIKLSKLYREDAEFFEVSSRYIILEGYNPTTFNLKVDYINLYKTNSITYNDFKNDQYLLKRYENIDFLDNLNFTLKYLDKFSDDKSIYFIDYDILVDYDLITNYSIIFYIVNFFNNTNYSNYTNSNKFNNLFSKDLIFEKFVDDSKINILKDFEVNFKIQNPNPFSIPNIKFKDYISKNFNLIKLNNMDSLNEVLELKPFESKTFSYILKLNENFNGSLLYLPRANLRYNNKTLFSKLILLVNKFEKVNKQLLIQKEIYPLDNIFVRIKINVENIGNIDLDDLIIDEDTLALNGSYVTGRSWKISNLNSGEKWNTYYDVKIENLNFFVPEVKNSEIDVLSSIVINNQFELKPIEKSNSDFYTQILMTFFVALLAADLLF